MAQTKTLFMSREYKMTLWAVWDYCRSWRRSDDGGDATLVTPDTVARRFADKRVLVRVAEHDDCYQVADAELGERTFREVERQS